jgi:formylglycine-generating enzyme required for sulfatase activity
MMGSPSGETHRNDELQHQVTLTKAFYCGKFEVTQGQWEQVMGRNPSYFKKVGKDAPVEGVSWNDCNAFVKKLCKMEGVPVGTYRLLTEAEWEYACRAGTQTLFCFGNALDLITVNFDGSYPFYSSYNLECRKTTVAVGSLRLHGIGLSDLGANAFGLCDMHGNVYELCQDWYADYPVVPLVDPPGPSQGTSRIYRGGCWADVAQNCRSALRGTADPDVRSTSAAIGVRIARSLPTSSP